MTIYVAKLNKAALEAIPSHERSLFLSLAHFSNELNAFHKLVLWSGKFTSRNNAEINGQLSLMLMFSKLLAGKLYEAYELLKKKFYGTKLSREYEDSLPAEARDALDQIKRYFSRSNIISHVRNNYAFHFSSEELRMTLPSVPDELEIYLQKDGSANNLYYFAEVIETRALLQSIDSEDEQIAYRKLMEEIGKVAHWFTIVCDLLVAEFIRRHISNIWKESATEVPFDNLEPFQNIRIPWFTDTANLNEDSY